MLLVGDVLFNLLLNAVGSFWLTLLATALVLRISRGRAGALGEFTLLLPFVKVVWDLLHGVPKGSFLWASERGVQQQLGSFRVGIGATPLGPVLRGEIWAHHRDGVSPQSLPDLLARALSHKVWIHAPAALGFALLAVSLLRLAVGARGLMLLHRFTSRVRAESQLLEQRKVGWRSVQILTSRSYDGVPFTGGVLRPFVVLPQQLLLALSERERAAVIEHELGHVAHFDLALLIPLEFLCGLLWYVPGTGWLLRRIRALLEFRADDAALAAGVSPRDLVSTLLTVAELTLTEPPPHALAMSRGGQLLRARIERLLSPVPAVRAPGRLALVARVLVVAWFVLGALQTVACGNHG